MIAEEVPQALLDFSMLCRGRTVAYWEGKHREKIVTFSPLVYKSFPFRRNRAMPQISCFLPSSEQRKAHPKKMHGKQYNETRNRTTKTRKGLVPEAVTHPDRLLKRHLRTMHERECRRQGPICVLLPACSTRQEVKPSLLMIIMRCR